MVRAGLTLELDQVSWGLLQSGLEVSKVRQCPPSQGLSSIIELLWRQNHFLFSRWNSSCCQLQLFHVVLSLCISQKRLASFSLFSFYQAVENSNLIPLPLAFSYPSWTKWAAPASPCTLWASVPSPSKCSSLGCLSVYLPLIMGWWSQNKTQYIFFLYVISVLLPHPPSCIIFMSLSLPPLYQCIY